MSLFHDIHSQPLIVRKAMYLMAVVATVGGIGFFWLTSVQRDMFFAIHPDAQERQQFVAQQDERMPQPLATIGKAFGSLTASIGSLMGFDSSRGFDRPAQQDKVYLLPTSQ
jgi:hypothetical protein